MRTLHSEWTKLRTTKGFWIILVLFFIICLGFTGLLVALSPKGTVSPSLAVVSVWQFGAILCIVQAVLIVCNEFRTGMIGTTLLVTPKRWQVMLGKVVCWSVISAVIGFILTVAALVIAAMILNHKMWFSWGYPTLFLWSIPLYYFLINLFSMGIALLIRSTASAMGIALVWNMMLENLLGMIPKVGPKITEWGPMSNASKWLNNSVEIKTALGIPLYTLNIQTKALAIFAVWAVAIFVVGFVLNERRSIGKTD